MPSFSSNRRLPALIVALTVIAAPAAAKPARVVSINLCADLLVLDLAEPAALASLTWLAADAEESPAAAKVRALTARTGLVLNHGAAEEILALRPDLVVAGRHTARATVTMARELGVPVLELDEASSLADIRANIRRLGAALGESKRAAALIAGMDRRLAALRGRFAGPKAPLVAIYQAGGATFGTENLPNEMLRTLGLRNLAARLGVVGAGVLPIESLLIGRPDVILLGIYRPGLPSLANRLLDHPALRAFRTRRPVIEIPTRLWSCGTPDLVEMGERLAAALADPGPGGAGEHRR